VNCDKVNSVKEMPDCLLCDNQGVKWIPFTTPDCRTYHISVCGCHSDSVLAGLPFNDDVVDLVQESALLNRRLKSLQRTCEKDLTASKKE